MLKQYNISKGDVVDTKVMLFKDHNDNVQTIQSVFLNPIIHVFM